MQPQTTCEINFVTCFKTHATKSLLQCGMRCKYPRHLIIRRESGWFQSKHLVKCDTQCISHTARMDVAATYVEWWVGCPLWQMLSGGVDALYDRCWAVGWILSVTDVERGARCPLWQMLSGGLDALYDRYWAVVWMPSMTDVERWAGCPLWQM